MPRHGRRCNTDDRHSVREGSDTAVATRHTARVGFDPTRKHKKTRFDYFYVAASVLVCVALVIWALA